MQLNFEQQKNIKAGVYTTIICVLLSLLFYIFNWNQAAPIILPPENSYMEVNLGNSETGAGDISPKSKEAPAPEIGNSKMVKASSNSNEIKVNNSVADENDKAIKSSITKNKVNSTPVPPVPKPKALMGKYAGGNGKGGNNQDSYNEVKDQGIVGGNGDQGVANGSIDGKSYTGQSGPLVTKGDRRITKAYLFNGDVEPATIYAEIEVSPSGVGRFVQIVKGSSSNDVKYKKAIVQYLTKISFNTSDRSNNVTVKFKFENQ